MRTGGGGDRTTNPVISGRLWLTHTHTHTHSRLLKRTAMIIIRHAIKLKSNINLSEKEGEAFCIACTEEQKALQDQHIQHSEKIIIEPWSLWGPWWSWPRGSCRFCTVGDPVKIQENTHTACAPTGIKWESQLNVLPFYVCALLQS